MTLSASSAPAKPPALLALGFRPFYLLACLYALLNVPLWMAQYQGLLIINGYFDALTWHAHELIFGFAAAVISGFLLTAVRNWTGQATATGTLLGSLALLWIAGRVLCLTGPPIAAASIDLLFLPAIGIAIGIPLIRTRNNNRPVLLVIAALWFVNLLMHLNQLGVMTLVLYPDTVNPAFDVIALLMAVIAGRVTPAFIRNAVRDAATRQLPAIEYGAISLLLVVLLLDVMRWFTGVSGLVLICLCVLTALIHFIRIILWSPGSTRGEPLLWILPLSYSWIPLWLLLRAAVEVDWVPVAVTHHALAIGAMASLMLGMMTRSALGHTGRALKAGRIETAAFVLIQLAVLFRILPLLVYPAAHQAGLMVSAACWTAAFAVVLIKYLPILSQPRIDGRPG